MNREQGIASLTRAHRFGVVFAVAAGLLWIAGCGGATAGSGTHLIGTTQVVVLAASTANDQLTHYSVSFTGMTLTNKAGKQVTVLSAPVSAEFIHLNGTVEPLATVTIPQDVYVSATVTVPSVALGCAQQFPGTLQIDGLLGTSDATVNLPAPITVTGGTMGWC